MIFKSTIGAACAINLMLCSAASAASFSFTGTFSADDDVQLLSFTLLETSAVSLLTYGYAGGIQANGNVVPSGGFDPVLALFDSAGNLIAKNDDGIDAGIVVPVDPGTGEAFDAALYITLAAGNYTASIMQYDNLAIGPSLSDGFTYSNDPFFTSLSGCTNGQFCDTSGVAPYNNRTNAWAFDVLNVATATSAVPVPAVAWLFASGLIGLIGWAKPKAH